MNTSETAESRTVTFLADNAPYQAGESATFRGPRAQTLVAAGVARYADGKTTDAADLVEAAIATDPQAGKRTGQATRYAKKG